MEQSRIKFIISETTEMHNEVAEAYEALIDNEKIEAVLVLDKIADRARALKADLLTKDN